MPEKQRYAVTQTVFIWAESRLQAARMVRRLQLQRKSDGPNDYSDFSVNDMEEQPDGSWIYGRGFHYGICIFDKDV